MGKKARKAADRSRPGLFPSPHPNILLRGELGLRMRKQAVLGGSWLGPAAVAAAAVAAAAAAAAVFDFSLIFILP